jgi:Endonuclease I/Secretion system C-terminal sorting domain
MKKVLLAFCCLAAGLLHAQTTLTVGDIAVIGYNYDNPDEIKFVNLVDIASGTQIKFTDNGWTGTALSTTEGTDTWTASGAYAKGTVHTFLVASMAMSTSGDQIFVYQGTPTTPTFIYGLSTTAWVTAGISSTTSRLPSALTTGNSALAFATERDNGHYTIMSNTGNKATLLSSISNSANWTTTDARITAFPAWTFSLNGFATEPTAQPTALNFSGIKSHAMSVDFTAASPAADGYIMLRANNVLPNADPVDGVTYVQGDQVGNAKVALIGTGTSVNIESVIANTTYGFKVYSYKGIGSQINYKQTSPLSGTVTSAATGMSNYYSTINAEVSTFISDLQTRIRSPYTKISYDNYDETMMTHFAFTDSTGGQKVATCIYSGQIYAYTPPFSWTPISPFSREHTWCVSWTPSNATPATNEYCDQHHLFPVNQNNANAIRNNHPLGEVVTIISSYLDGTYGLDANGNNVYEPRDAHKGDAARALLYMSLRYNGVGGFDWTFDHLNNSIMVALSEDPQSVATLLQWHAQDPPSNYEIARNDYIYSIQNNRNPLIDHPEWINHINFNNLSYIPTPPVQPNSQGAASFAASNAERMELLVWPNPMNENGLISIDVNKASQANCMMVSLTGQIVLTKILNLQSGNNTIEFDASRLTSGAYIVVVETNGKREFIRFIVE